MAVVTNCKRSGGSQTALRWITAAVAALIVISAYGSTGENVPNDHEFNYSPYVGQQVPRQVYWGDTHLHTANSGDAFGLGARLGPEEAYRFARGETVTSSTGLPARLARPLDFLVVADHAEGLGTMRELYRGNETLNAFPVLQRWQGMMQEGGARARVAVNELIRAVADGTLPEGLTDPKIVGPIIRSVWTEYTETAERYNEPGRFTALLGYEWTSVPGGNNLHRVVVFRDGKDRVDQVLPFSAFQSENPADLWGWLDRYQRKTGGRVLAIPHNGNLSNGRMFPMLDFAGQPLSRELAEARSRWEPVTEVTQIKGDSESHPFLSPNDEFAGYGDAGWDNGNLSLQELSTPEMYAGEYAREALKRGLRLEQELGTNPYEFGMIGSTDSHTGLSTADDDNYFAKNVQVEPRPHRVAAVTKQYSGVTRYGWHYVAGGYAAVWATHNSREALFDAIQQREVYATTGPRITVRFFGGWDFNAADALAPDLARLGYRKGVPMGSILPARNSDSSPRFLIGVQKDPLGANLDRVQVIKGWVDADGQLSEKVFDVAWSEGRRIDPTTGKLPAVGSTVHLEDASWTNRIGASQLLTTWQDPQFDAALAAFYYVRVLQIPTPRWSSYDAARFGIELPAEVPREIQERAYTSPIWYKPAQ